MLTSLDDDDLRILQLLQHDARLTYKEIADKIGKSVTPVHDRIKRLHEAGYIVQFAAILDNKLIHKSLLAYTHVRLKVHAQEMTALFEKEVTRYPEVIECYQVSGEFDFLLKIAVGDMDEYYAIIIERLSKIPNVGTLQSSFVLRESKKTMAYSLDLAGKNAKKKKSPSA